MIDEKKSSWLCSDKTNIIYYLMIGHCSVETANTVTELSQWKQLVF